jgi:peptidoglycan biosynthesis protein MviN/MurJ (putative lipid II flippase)
VIAGRANITTRNFPAAFAGLVANVILLITLVPSLGIAGAGIALCGAYAVMLTVMYLLTRRAFSVAFEWRRLTHLTVVIGGIAAVGDVLLPTHGASGFFTRLAAFAAIPVVLAVTGFAHQRELDGVRSLLSRAARRRAASEPV